MNPLSVLQLISGMLPLFSQLTRVVLHTTGADQHKTIAADVADKLDVAAAAAKVFHDALLDAQGSAPGGGA